MIGNSDKLGSSPFMGMTEIILSKDINITSLKIMIDILLKRHEVAILAFSITMPVQVD